MAESPDFDRGWNEPRRRQARLGLTLTPLERLRWLEQSVAELRRWQQTATRIDRKGQDDKP